MQGASRGARLACEAAVTKGNRIAGLYAVCALLCERGKVPPSHLRELAHRGDGIERDKRRFAARSRPVNTASSRGRAPRSNSYTDVIFTNTFPFSFTVSENWGRSRLAGPSVT